MPVPASLLDAVDAHACFSGCYSHETPVALVTDPGRPPVVSFHAACQDCLMFHVGSLASLLPHGMTQYGLAQELAAHTRRTRGYRWAISGYHATGQGFWLSAAYYGDGLFLVDGSRNHGGTRDVDLLVRAFRSKLVQPDDQGMLDPALYASEIVHIDATNIILPKNGKSDILRSAGCSLSPRQGLRRTCIVEFLPLTTVSKLTSGVPSITIPNRVGGVSSNITLPVGMGNTAKQTPTWNRSDIGHTCNRCHRQVKELAILGKIEYNCMC